MELRRLVIKAFDVKDVILSYRFFYSKGLLEIDKKITGLIEDPLIKKIEINVIKPGEHDVAINTIMDIIPISVKALGRIGSGITHTMTGAYVMLTGCDEDGRQMHEFGSSEGILKEQLKLNKAGTPSDRDYIIHIDVLIKGGEVYDRRLPNAAFKACDIIISKIREIIPWIPEIIHRIISLPSALNKGNIKKARSKKCR